MTVECRLDQPGSSQVTNDRPDVVEILAPTLFEYLIIRTARPGVRVRHAGMRLSRWRDDKAPEMVILCGLAGSLTPELRPGDVVIPDECAFEGDGVRLVDPTLACLLRQTARSRGYTPLVGRLLTSRRLVTGDERKHWAEKGFMAADMEAALLTGAVAHGCDSGNSGCAGAVDLAGMVESS